MSIKSKVIGAGLAAVIVMAPSINEYVKENGEPIVRKVSNVYSTTIDRVANKINVIKNNIFAIIYEL